jgi:hypothetical protein
LAMNAPNRSSYDTIRVLIRLDVLSVHTIAYAILGARAGDPFNFLTRGQYTLLTF